MHLVNSAEANTINVSNWNTSKVTNMSYMFKGMQNIDVLDLSSFNILSNADIGAMFNSSLKTVYVSTQATVNKLNSIKPSSLNIIIK